MTKSISQVTRFTVSMLQTRETKGTYLFTEVAPDGSALDSPRIGTMYIRKRAFDGVQPPTHIQVTVESV